MTGDTSARATFQKFIISIDKKIKQQKPVVSKAKDKYYTIVVDIEKLMSKRDETKKEELLDTITTSHMSYDEIIATIKDAEQQKSDQSDVES